MEKRRVMVVVAPGVLLARGRVLATPPAPGSAKIVGVLEEDGDGLSAEEIAKRTGTDLETVRGCTDRWRRTMKA